MTLEFSALGLMLAFGGGLVSLLPQGVLWLEPDRFNAAAYRGHCRCLRVSNSMRAFRALVMLQCVTNFGASYMARKMSLSAISPAASCFRRWLVASLCLLMLLAAIIPPRSAEATPLLSGEVQMHMVDSDKGGVDDSSDRPSGASGHGACHHGCKPAAVSDLGFKAGLSTPASASAPATPTPSHALASTVSDLPLEPPRA